ncbi:response regulator transcription factor [Tateyamaria pelophila]|uniref:response regulator transcription factor n=1 Tax=Tateyamaria pelophila TaxID=328415 RepID=UPI001CBEE826|nr:response regulator [Tateyamaria pelophila]
MLDAINDTSLMIVEDDDALRGRLARAMDRRGFDVREASSLSEAMAQADTELPKYAVVDLRLLDGSGLSFVETLEQRDPGIRAIILTGYGNIPTAVAAVRAGAIDFIAKPATADEIVEALIRPRNEHPPAPSAPMTPDAARREHIEHVFHELDGNVSKTARALDMHRRTLQRLLKRYGDV